MCCPEKKKQVRSERLVDLLLGSLFSLLNTGEHLLGKCAQDVRVKVAETRRREGIPGGDNLTSPIVFISKSKQPKTTKGCKQK